jgi:excisionase family DNA binding protein
VRFTRASRTPTTEWLGLGEASRLLGVSPGTLRRWSDAGRVDAFTTPGGHRRYRRTSLERMLPADRPARGVAVRSIVTPSRLGRVYRTEARTASRQLPWLATMDEERRHWFRDQGRRLVEELLAHLDAPDAEASRHHLAEATAIASSYGRTASAMGAGLSDALEAFLRFRHPFLDELAAVLHRRGVDGAHADVVERAADRAMDALLIAAMAAHSVQRVAGVGPAATRRTRRVGPDPRLEDPSAR